MTLSVRRIVTGHNANGKAVVAIDELVVRSTSCVRARRVP